MGISEWPEARKVTSATLARANSLSHILCCKGLDGQQCIRPNHERATDHCGADLLANLPSTDLYDHFDLARRCGKALLSKVLRKLVRAAQLPAP